MRPARIATAILISGIVNLFFPTPNHARQSDPRYELHGKVLNSATGAGVPFALVQLSPTQAQFTGPDGSFVFTDLPARSTYQLSARKPGYFNDTELQSGFPSSQSAVSVPSDSEVVLRLTPEGVIYGRVENDSAQPFEGVSVRVQNWVVLDGRKELAVAGTATTEDEGQFRIADLKPGTYYLNFVPNGREGFRIFNSLVKKVPSGLGYGSQFYPSAPDISSATAIRIRPGSQVQVAQKMKRQRLYEVAGVVRGASTEKGFQVILIDSEGVPVAKDVHIDPKTGEFQMTGVPEGAYLLTAMAQDPADDAKEEHPPLSASLPIHLNADLTGLSLMLGHGASIDVNIEDQLPAKEGEIHQIQITLSSKEFQQTSQGLALPPTPEAGQIPHGFENVAPGSYEVLAFPSGPFYIASLQCGDLDLFREDLTVATGAQVPPIDVVLRNDGAELSIESTQDGQPAFANVALYSVVLYSEEYPRQSRLLQSWGGGKASANNLRPGPYKVLAFPATGAMQELEFRDPQAMEKYLAGAKEVNLKPGDQTSIRVEVQSLNED